MNKDTGERTPDPEATSTGQQAAGGRKGIRAIPAGLAASLGFARTRHGSPAEGPSDRSTILAMDRTYWAAERTLMGWIRTALSMISFGFTIFKFLEYVQEQGMTPLRRPHGPRDVGITLIGIGIFALVIACAQHWRFMKNLRPDQPYKPWDLTFIVAVMIGLLGSAMFVSMILRVGPLGD